MDNQLGLGGLLNRQVGRLVTFKNAAGVYAGKAMRVSDAGDSRSPDHLLSEALWKLLWMLRASIR